MSGLRVVLAVAITMLITPTAVRAEQATNLIANGDGESGLSGWQVVAGTPTALGYAVGGGYPTADDPGPARRGEHFFAGGDTPRSTLRQRVGMPNKPRCFALTGWLGGYAEQQDGARFSVEFIDGAGTPLGVVVLGPVTAEDRRSVTSLLERGADGKVPPGSRTAVVTLQMTRSGGGTSNDGYADNLSLVIGGC